MAYVRTVKTASGAIAVACALVDLPARRFDTVLADRPAHRGKEPLLGVDDGQYWLSERIRR